MINFVWLILFCLWIFSSSIVSEIAKEKGLSYLKYFIISFFLSPIFSILCVIASDRKKNLKDILKDNEILLNDLINNEKV